MLNPIAFTNNGGTASPHSLGGFYLRTPSDSTPIGAPEGTSSLAT